MYCENKGADQFAVTAKLICVFVFAYAKSQFSHNEADIISAHNTSLEYLSTDNGIP